MRYDFGEYDRDGGDVKQSSDHSGRSSGDCRQAGGNGSKPNGRKVSEPQYPWITEAYEVIRPMLPCSVNDAIAALMTGMTQRAAETATRQLKNPSRFSAAKLAIGHLQKCRIIVRDGQIERKSEIERKLIGDSVMCVLKSNGKIKEGETGFKGSSVGTYRKILRKLGWIRVEANEWFWVGPEGATWRDVTRENAKRK